VKAGKKIHGSANGCESVSAAVTGLSSESKAFKNSPTRTCAAQVESFSSSSDRSSHELAEFAFVVCMGITGGRICSSVPSRAYV
jgi:hypothetical protein